VRGRRRDCDRSVPVGSRADFILYRGDVERGPFEMARVLEVAKDGVRFVAGGRRVAN